jgi:hypothetical protein
VFGGVQHGETDDFAVLVTDYDVVISEFAISRVAWFFEVDEEHVSLWVIR